MVFGRNSAATSPAVGPGDGRVEELEGTVVDGEKHAEVVKTAPHTAPGSIRSEKSMSPPVEEGSYQTQPDEFPDGGTRAWLVLLGTVCATFSTFGYFACWGVFQTYYEESVMPGRSPSDIAWIGSMQTALCIMPGILTGRMFDLGYFKIPYLISSLLLVISTVLVAECTEYWHFMLCQGLATGIACGGLYGPTMGCLGHYFKRRRGLALGIAGAGSASGGVVFPIASRLLLSKVGFQWTMRILALILLCALTVTNITLKRRLPPRMLTSGLINWKSLKSPAFASYIVASFLVWHTIFTMLTYLDISSMRIGISPDFSFYLLAILNAGSVVGRIASGPFIDRFGCINILAPLTILSGVLTIVWPHLRTVSGLIPLAVFYGITSGAYLAACLAVVFQLGPVEEVGQRTGIVLTVSAIGALAGPPTSGAINFATGGYAAVGGYAGAVTFLGVAMMFVTRYYVLRGKFVGKV